MRLVSISVNKNNSRATIEFTSENGLLSGAEDIATKHNCGFSHNVRIEPGKGELYTPKSFGSISFNKGNHSNALNEFLSQH